MRQTAALSLEAAFEHEGLGKGMAMPNQKSNAGAGKFVLDLSMPPANDLVFCDMFENEALFKRIIRAVVGKNEKVELKERPMSQVSYGNPQLSELCFIHFACLPAKMLKICGMMS